MQITRSALGLVLLLSGSLVLAAGAEVVLKRTPVKDSKQVYEMEAKLEVGGQELQVRAKVTDRIVSVEGDRYTTGSVQSDTRVTFAGQEVPIPDEAPSEDTAVQKLDGELIAYTGKQASPEQVRLSHLLAFIFPDKAVNVGDTWTRDLKPVTVPAVPIRYEFKLVGEEKVGPTDTHKVEAKVEEKEGDAASKAQVTWWIDKGDGSIVKMDARGTNLPIPGAPGPVSGTLLLRRQ